MTEAVFLALLVWSVVATMEGVAALRGGQAERASARMLLAGLLVLGMVFTRYDGWIIGAVVWSCFCWEVSKTERNVRRQVLPAFVICTVLCVAGPLLMVLVQPSFRRRLAGLFAWAILCEAD